MRKTRQTSGERIVKDIKRKTRKRYSAEEKIRIVLDGLRGEESIAELCRQEGIIKGNDTFIRHAVDLKNILGKIDADCGNVHLGGSCLTQLV